MTFLGGMRNLPLRMQLMLVFALLAIVTTTISTLTLTKLSEDRMRSAMRDRSERIARRLQQQLVPIVAFDDHLSARELFQAYAADKELDGIAVYAANGELIEGRGLRPPELPSIDSALAGDRTHSVAVAEIKTRDGRAGRLYLSFSTKLVDRALRRDAWIAAAIGTSVAFSALLLALWTSRHIAHRLVSIADAAKRMASGDRAAPALNDTAHDEIGALARAFNQMVTELNRLSTEHERLVLTERERLERLVSERTQTLEQSREMFKLIAESTKAIPFTLDLTRGYFPYMGAQAIMDAGLTEDLPNEFGTLERVIPRASNPELRQLFDECAAGPFEFEAPMVSLNGLRMEMRWTGTCAITHDAKHLRGLMQNVTELRRLERELAAAQKLESVGRLAAGVAHEINTPVQYVSDNIQFVRTSMADLATIIQAYRHLRQTLQIGRRRRRRGAAGGQRPKQRLISTTSSRTCRSPSTAPSTGSGASRPSCAR